MSSPLSSLYDREVLPQLSTESVVRWFKIVAFAEAVSWALLLAGMYFKYLAPNPTGIYVSIFGSVHGAVFVAFGLITLLTAQRLRWSVGTLALGLLSSIPPFATIPFEMWAQRTGKLDAGQPAAASATGS